MVFNELMHTHEVKQMKMIKFGESYSRQYLLPVECLPFLAELKAVDSQYISASSGNYNKYQHYVDTPSFEIVDLDTMDIEPCERPKNPDPAPDPAPVEAKKPATLLPLTNDEQSVPAKAVPDLREFVDLHRDGEAA